MTRLMEMVTVMDAFTFYTNIQCLIDIESITMFHVIFYFLHTKYGYLTKINEWRAITAIIVVFRCRWYRPKNCIKPLAAHYSLCKLFDASCDMPRQYPNNAFSSSSATNLSELIASSMAHTNCWKLQLQNKQNDSFQLDIKYTVINP